jgi:hypothetical protein
MNKLNDIDQKLTKFNKQFTYWFGGFAVSLLFCMVFYLDYVYFLPIIFMLFTGFMMLHARIVFSYLRIIDTIHTPENYIVTDPEDAK